jgi:hypothetical protein
MVWMAIRASEEDIRAAFLAAGIEVIETGDGQFLGGFLERATSLEGPWGMVWLQGVPLAQLINPRDRAFVALMEGEPQPVAVASDKRLFSSLVDMVTAQVQEKGGCLLDLRDFGLSSETAKAIAERGGLNVSIGLKAVFTPQAGGR